jgi:hypothetical protein
MESIRWLHETNVPRCVAAALDGLRFDVAPEMLPDASPQEWEGAIYYLHRNQLTLMVRHACGGSLPGDLHNQFDAFYGANCARLAPLRATTSEAIGELKRAGIETVLLKGFARAGEYVPDPDARMHYDVDLYCPHAADEAALVLWNIGYEPISASESDEAGHLAPMARPTSWKWRDDFFDLETPVHVELHRRLWTPEFECFPFSGLDEFWARREKDGSLCTLSRHDTLAYRCMHLLRHLLRGDIRAAGVFEIAYFLHQNHLDEAFWAAWQSKFPDDLQQGQAVCFALARRWFGCKMHAIPLLSANALRKPIVDWMSHSGASPVESFFIPGKQELALHFALVDSASAKLRIALRRLLPLHAPQQMWEDRGAYLRRLKSRAVYHARALAPTLLKLPIIRR